MLAELGMRQPESGIAYSLAEAVRIADRIGYPVLVRPSYVLGGRGMETCFDEESLRRYMKTAVDVSDLGTAPVLIVGSSASRLFSRISRRSRRLGGCHMDPMTSSAILMTSQLIDASSINAPNASSVCSSAAQASSRSS